MSSAYPILDLLSTWPQRPSTGFLQWTNSQTDAFFAYVLQYIEGEATKQWLSDARNEVAKKWNQDGFATYFRPYARGASAETAAAAVDAMAAASLQIFLPRKATIKEKIDAKLGAAPAGSGDGGDGADTPSDARQGEAPTNDWIKGVPNVYVLFGAFLLLIVVVLIVGLIVYKHSKGDSDDDYDAPMGMPMGMPMQMPMQMPMMGGGSMMTMY